MKIKKLDRGVIIGPLTVDWAHVNKPAEYKGVEQGYRIDFLLTDEDRGTLFEAVDEAFVDSLKALMNNKDTAPGLKPKIKKLIGSKSDRLEAAFPEQYDKDSGDPVGYRLRAKKSTKSGAPVIVGPDREVFDGMIGRADTVMLRVNPEAYAFGTNAGLKFFLMAVQLIEKSKNFGGGGGASWGNAFDIEEGSVESAAAGADSFEDEYAS